MTNVWGNILILVFAHCVGSQGNQCGEPTKYPDRQLEEKYRHISDFKHDDNVEYNCAPGYRRKGGSRISFCKEGRWTPSDLTCKMVKCPVIEIINSKKFSQKVRYNTTLNITCKHGFILRGAQHLRCELNGSWTPDVPKCEPESTVTCSSPAVAHRGIQSGEKPQYKLGDIFTISCLKGFGLIGSSQTTCGSDGQWVRLPECRPKGNCGPAPDYPHAHLRDEYSPAQREYTAEARLRYKCTIGHRLAAGRGVIYCRSGQWTELQMTCEPMRCGSAEEILNGRIEYTGVSYGDTATVICDEGHEPIGRPVRHCRDGGWDGRNAECEPVYCPPPPLVKNADMFDLTYEQVPFGNMVSYRCRTGSLIGAQQIHCTKNGTWSAPPPECRESTVTCSSPAVAHRGIKSGEKPQYKPGDIFTISCLKGFGLIGSSQTTCGSDGQWVRLPECRPEVRCSTLLLENGKIQSGEKPHYKPRETVTVSCTEGYDLIGSSLVTCGPQGQWVRLPECRPEVRCSALLMENGKIQSGEKPHYKPRETVTVSCTEGYDLIGSSLVTCGSDGQWVRLPECRPEVRCSALLMVNGKIQSGEKPHYKPRETVTISCTEGYDLIGSSLVTCGPQGQWQRLPECRFKVSLKGNCGPAPDYPHAHLRDEYSPAQREYTAEARLRYKCTIGHRLAAGRGVIYCRSGQWTELQMTCEPMRCGSAEEILNGRIEYTGVSYGDTATVICDEGHEAIGRPVRHCRDGGWDGRNAECEPVYCPPPPLVKNADMFDLTYEQVPFGNMVSYRCRTGSLIGAKQIHCTNNGTWSAPPPECRDIVCPVPKLPNASGMMGYRSVYRFGDTVRIKCNPGPGFAEEYYVKCGLDGEWTPEPSTLCRPPRFAHYLQKRSLP